MRTGKVNANTIIVPPTSSATKHATCGLNVPAMAAGCPYLQFHNIDRLRVCKHSVVYSGTDWIDEVCAMVPVRAMTRQLSGTFSKGTFRD